MKILIIAATSAELKGIQNYLENKNNLSHHYSFIVSGIGSVFTCFNLMNYLNNQRPDLVINIGIAGSFRKEIKIGDVINIESEQFADLGIDDNGEFKSVFDMKFINSNEPPFENGILHNSNNSYLKYLRIKNVSSITVNTASGSEKRINLLTRKYNADIENMEGASIFYICLQKKIDFLEIRAISNFIEKRNRENWDIKKALQSLQEELVVFIKRLENEN